MTTVNRSMYPLQTSFTLLSRMQERMSQLQLQLATGEKAATLGELGADRSMSLNIRSRLGRLDAFGQSAGMVNLRLDMLDKTMSRLDAIEAETRGLATPGGYGTGSINLSTTPTLARAKLDEVLNLLNSDVAGRYLYAGSASDKKPVESTDAILNGVAGRAGFAQVVTERKLADAGSGPITYGRLGVTTASATVTLAEDGAHPFGFKLSTLSTTSAGATLTQPTGSPQSLAVQFTALPLAGETVTIGLTLPDGTSQGLVLKAVSGAPAAPGEFQVGADADATAANFDAALKASIHQTAITTLQASSVYAAADNFFNAQGGQVLRVDGPPFETAIATQPATSADTVLWYKGADAPNARQSVSAKVDDGARVAYGVQANEGGLVALVRDLAAQAVESYPISDPTSRDRFDAMAGRQLDRLSEAHNTDPGSIEAISVELGSAKAMLGSISDRRASYRVQLENMLSSIEGISDEEVTMELLALKTRLEASYQTTSIVSQLSLVNYIR